MGFMSYKGKGRFWGFLFHIFTMGNAIVSPTVRCFRFVCDNFVTFPFRKRIVGKQWAFWRYIKFQHQSSGLWEIHKNVTTVLRNLRPTQQGCWLNVHIHESTPRALLVLATAAARGPFPNYFGQTCYIIVSMLSNVWCSPRRLFVCGFVGVFVSRVRIWGS